MKNNLFWIRYKRSILVAFGVCVLTFVMLLPLPYYIESPGTAESIGDHLVVNHKKDNKNGDFLLTTVYVQKASPLTLLYSKLFGKYDEILNENEVTGGSSNQEYDVLQRYYMTDSINQAKFVAFKAAHKKVSLEFQGVYVMSVLEKSKFYHVLKPGDVITSINNKKFASEKGFISYVSSQKNGQKVRVKVKRKGVSKIVVGKLMPLDKTKKSGLGITLINKTNVETEIPVKANVASLGGPSGGLMFTLQIYAQLMDVDVKHGQKIAGTGTMSSNGEVGDIGGIDKKIVAADKENVSIFFAPNNELSSAELKSDPNALNNYQLAKKTAKQIGSNMKVIPVKKFSDALNYLENIKNSSH
ncbi:SepM family pheromone-processing serine protease [Dellaglioa algida]|uniref:SepM family pheromone-processing serine protease n=1 Tax=Dellaglioa algida TaxID=105612 RepID=UPI0024C4BF2C|nr:SepM family pheromone-processing serine protease [Dellaglioa algida]MDK1726203.1 PDZ domain-containing protein [Dellaglioa algida]